MKNTYTEDGLHWTGIPDSPPYKCTKFFFYREYYKQPLSKYVYSLVYQTVEDDLYKPVPIDYDKKHDGYAIGVSVKGQGMAHRFFDNWEEAAHWCSYYSIHIRKEFHPKTRRPIEIPIVSIPCRIWYITKDICK